MIAAIDVQYDQHETAMAGMVMFEDWNDDEPFRTYQHEFLNCAAYEPGNFYRREMPVLLETISRFPGSLDVIVVDCYVDFDIDHPGLGRRLYEEIDGKSKVVGVAKSRYRASQFAEEVLRGESLNPLFVTAAGISNVQAGDWIRDMAGDYRIPKLLKLADAIARQHVQPSEKS